MLAFLETIGFQEMVILGIVGLLLYGRNLPEAGRTLGQMAAKFRRGFQEFKDQLDRDGDLRQVKNTMRDAAQELKKVADVPLAIGDPTRALRNLTHEALSSPLPDAPPAEAPAAQATNPAEPAPTQPVEPMPAPKAPPGTLPKP